MTAQVAGPDGRPRVLVARAAHQQARLADALRSRGFEPVEVPLLAIDPPADGGAALAVAVAALSSGDVDAVGLTSPNGARALAVAIATHGQQAASDLLRDVVVGCVGPGTAAATRDALGVEPTFVATVHTTAGLGQDFPPGPGRVLLPRADIASPRLPRLLATGGWQVDDVAAYRTRLVTQVAPDVRDALGDGRIAAVAVASPSTVDALVAALDGAPLRARVVSIGPVSSSRARHHGLVVEAEADPHDMDGLVDALTRTLAPVVDGPAGDDPR